MTQADDAVRRGYLEAAGQFQSALASGVPVVSRTYSIATRRVRLRIVGPRLAEHFVPAWQHLEDPAAVPGRGELSIDLWHRAETGIEGPAAVREIDPLSRFPYQVSREDRFLAVRQQETSAWLDREKRHIVGVVGDVDRRALYESGRPLETPMLVWLRDERVPLVHGSFVAHAGRGVLILGRSGSGKSTLAAECLCDGFEFLGDDKIAFARGSHEDFIGYSLNSSLHLDASALARFPELTGQAIPPRLAIDDKYRIPVERICAERLCSCAPIRALVIPTIEGGARIEQVSKKAALLALSLSTLLSLPIASDRSLNQLAELAEAVPAYAVGLAPDRNASKQLVSLLEGSR